MRSKPISTWVFPEDRGLLFYNWRNSAFFLWLDLNKEANPLSAIGTYPVTMRRASFRIFYLDNRKKSQKNTRSLMTARNHWIDQHPEICPISGFQLMSQCIAFNFQANLSYLFPVTYCGGFKIWPQIFICTPSFKRWNPIPPPLSVGLT